MCNSFLLLMLMTAMDTTAPVIAPEQVPAPTVFEPGVISRGAHEAALAFEADGKTVYFQRSNTDISTILVSREREGRWSTPVVAEFSGQWSDMEPALAPDGSFLVFASSRPLFRGGAPIDGFYSGKRQPGAGGNLWRVDRTSTGWGEPYLLPATINTGTSVFAPDVLRDGSLLFMRPDPITQKFRLFRSQRRGRDYEAAIALPFSSGLVTDVDPVADPDGRFIVFASGRPPAKGMDLFIVKNSNGKWGEPRHLGPLINAEGSDAEPRLSPDGRQLYFSSERILRAASPRSRSDAPQELEDAAIWNNGQYNIWTIDLSPWLGADSEPKGTES